MENLNFINPLLHGIIPEEIEEKVSGISAKQLIVAGVGTLIAGAVLKKAGHTKTAAFIGSIALPLLASAIYKKVGSSKTSKNTEDSNFQSDFQLGNA